MEINHTEDYEVKKRYLSRYRNNIYCILRLECKLEKTKIQANTVRSQTYTEKVSGGIHKRQEDLCCEVIDLETRIKSLKAKGRKLKAEITAVIDELENYREAEVLELYYIDCKTMNEISYELNYSWRHTERLFLSGMNKVDINVIKMS